MISDDILIEKAIQAQSKAICPYSNYPVGAALLTEEEEIVIGFNIESKAYPTTLCAERVAIFSALSLGYKKFKKIAVVTNNKGMPCGSCRQIIHEFAGDIPIIVSDTKKNIFKTTTKDILPHPFG
tara:strand:- start:121 stop:495 length:375 start_codon:yes stop_codon:yes gene_type:complete